MAAGALQLSPPALDFGRAALATAHALTVTLTNTANTTMHLASVAGTTPDFHASFFESKVSSSCFNLLYSHTCRAEVHMYNVHPLVAILSSAT